MRGGLKRAQEMGIAERDPRGDVLGTDAGYKATILHCLAFHPPITYGGGEGAGDRGG